MLAILATVTINVSLLVNISFAVCFNPHSPHSKYTDYCPLCLPVFVRMPEVEGATQAVEQKTRWGGGHYFLNMQHKNTKNTFETV